MATRRRRKNKPIAIESGIPIRLVDRKKKPFMIDIVRAGVRKRACYATLEDARQAAIEEAGKLVQEGLQAVALTRDQRLDAERAINISNFCKYKSKYYSCNNFN